MSGAFHYHLTGVAGMGMSALAQVLLADDCEVSGSDRDFDSGKDLEIIRKLQGAGVRFVPQDGSRITDKTRSVVISTDIEDDNPDVLAANRLNVPVIHRAEMLAGLVEDKQCVAVTGTSGKSTVTGMIGWVLEQLGADPVVVNGAVVLNWWDENRIGNVRIRGKGAGAIEHRTSNIEHRTSNIPDLWVIEADESDRSLLNFRPDWAVITNVSEDHFGLEETIELFRTFSGQVKTGLVSALAEPDFLREFNPELSARGVRFTYGDAAFEVSLPGRHNAENALYAVVLCERLGFDLEGISRALACFKGIKRRLETVGTAGGITVIDDYAHNPAKIWAAWQAVAPYCKRVLAVWRPHGFGPLSKMMDKLVSIFGELCGESDRIYVLPVYDAGGTANRRVNSDMLVEKLRAGNIPAFFAGDPEELVETIVETAEPGDVVLMMGARDPGLPVLAHRLYRACKHTEGRQYRPQDSRT